VSGAGSAAGPVRRALKRLVFVNRAGSLPAQFQTILRSVVECGDAAACHNRKLRIARRAWKHRRNFGAIIASA
ncbi:MAG: hypothetical protein ACHQIO_15490, partial [Nevskiales bacterium]